MGLFDYFNGNKGIMGVPGMGASGKASGIGDIAYRGLGYTPTGFFTGMGDGPLSKYSPMGVLTNPENNWFAKKLGLSGEQGEYYQADEVPELLGAPEIENYVTPDKFQGEMFSQNQERAKAMGDSGLQQLRARFGSGEIGLNDLPNLLGNNWDKPGQMQQFYEDLATDPLSGSTLATGQVMNNPLLKKAFANQDAMNESLGGMRNKAMGEESELASRGFSLQPEDHEAYGQASGQLARLFGSQEQDLAQSLAARGLSAAPSGAAGVGFSGLQGNKFEQLAGLQRQIADQRMNMNQQRLTQTRDYLTKLNQQQQSGLSDALSQRRGAIDEQFGRQMAGVQSNRNQRQGMSENELAKYQSDLQRSNILNNAISNRNASYLDRYNMGNTHNMNRYALTQRAKQDTLASKKANKGMTLADALGRGLFKTAEAAPQTAANMALGSAVPTARV